LLINQDLLARDVINIAKEEQELDNADLQPANQDNTAIKVVAGDDWGWGVVLDEGDWVAKAGDNSTDIEIV
jgi:hypothetical protein